MPFIKSSGGTVRKVTRGQVAARLTTRAKHDAKVRAVRDAIDAGASFDALTARFSTGRTPKIRRDCMRVFLRLNGLRSPDGGNQAQEVKS